MVKSEEAFLRGQVMALRSVLENCDAAISGHLSMAYSAAESTQQLRAVRVLIHLALDATQQ